MRFFTSSAASASSQGPSSVGSKPDLAQVLTHYGAQNLPDYGYNRSIRCPFHDDTRSSASINIEDQLFKCFTCGIQGDVYAVIMQVEGVDFVEAKRRAEAIAGAGGDEVRTEQRVGRFISVSSRHYQSNGRKPKARGRTRSRTWS